MACFLLVHGAWHGGWCWDRIVACLQSRGHTALAPDLPGHGDDRTPLPLQTLDTYVNRVGEALADCQRPAILVGHSQGGIVITAAAERFPDMIDRLVYAAAFLPRSGQSLVGILRENQVELPLPYVDISPDRTSMTVKAGAIEEYLGHDCPREDLERAKARLVPEPMSISLTPVVTTEYRYGHIPRVYVECLQDRAIPIQLQRTMHRAVPCDEVISLDTGHCVFSSAPLQFAELLHRLSGC